MFHRLIVLVLALWPLAAQAQTPDPQPPGPAPDPERPALNPFPAEQNWSFLSDPSKRTDFFDPAKYIPFSGNPHLYLSVGFEYRIEYEYDDNWMFGAGPQYHHGYVMNRVMPHFDFHAGKYFRLFSEFEFGDSRYAPIVWSFLNDVAPTDEGGFTRKERLIQTWITLKRTDPPSTSAGKNKIDRVTSQPSDKLPLTVDDLEDRSAMLEDVRAKISFLKRDLAALVLSLPNL